ncbi:SCO family protein [Bradymonas sediminis]|nr:SCO family protein [Bradymonas sediminis]TDP75455.1 cytochrome oxidase Cu insertion factor (SCO1/SenC/PrrC family) [Bradymonas sediminis]
MSASTEKMTTRWESSKVLKVGGLLLVFAGLVGLGWARSAPWRSAATQADSPAPEHQLRGIHFSPPRAAPALVAVDDSAKPFSLARQPHPLAMVFFGYVGCTDVCPTNLKKFEKIQQILGPEADQVQFVFVTIDPASEPPAKMKEYLSYYKGEIIGVTSETPDGLDEAYESWKIVRNRVELEKPVNGLTYKYDHTGQIFLVQNGDKIPVSYPYGTSTETMAEDLQALLADPALGTRLPEIGEVKDVSIPAGSYRRAAQMKPTLPAYIRVKVGEGIRWTNNDYMYHFVGDISLAPGASATQVFDKAGDLYLGCTALPDEVIRISVQEDGGDAI